MYIRAPTPECTRQHLIARRDAMNRRIIVTASAMMAVGLASLPTSAIGQQKSLKEQLVGTWRSVSTIITHPDGTKVQPFDDNPKGALIFNGDGNFVLLNTRSDLPKIASKNRLDVTPEEARTVYRGIYGFFGTYDVSEADRTFKLTVVGSTFPNEVGNSDTRVVKSIGPDEFVYTNVAGAGGGPSR
jgi:hypothetical protein